MRSKAVLTMVLLALFAGSSVHADEVLLWDNYPGDVLQNAAYNMSSERNTQVVESTWIADDVDLLEADPGFDPGVAMITRLEWVGARQVGFSYSLADVVILDAAGDGPADVKFLAEDLSYTFTAYDPEPNPDPETQTYHGEITFDEPISVADLGLSDNHLYIGVRLVGDGYYEGRNYFVTSSIDGTLRGRTQGYAKGTVFGAPDWTPASEVWYGYQHPDNFEFAFRLWAVPEPASLALLLVGSLLLVRRR
jgi:hypothetical protein